MRDGTVVIVEFTMDHPIFRAPFRRVPDVDAKWGMTQGQVDGPTQMTVWVETAHFDRLDEALADDPGPENPSVITEHGNRCLYRVDYTERGRETNILPITVENGGVPQFATGSSEGWTVRIEFPDREAVEQLFQFCRDTEIDFTFDRIFEQSHTSGAVNPTLSLVQEETLVEAVECGYLSIPRDCSLADLADRLDVSHTAASERFRRGTRNLVRATLLTESSSGSDGGRSTDEG